MTVKTAEESGGLEFEANSDVRIQSQRKAIPRLFSLLDTSKGKEVISP